MEGKSTCLYKVLVVGVIVLFILTSFHVIPCKGAPYNSTYCGWVNPNNQPPEPPIIDGPKEIIPDIPCEYSFRAIDPKGHDIAKYMINWGDCNKENLTGPYKSGAIIFAKHMWHRRGEYAIKAKAVDTYGAESNWSEFVISIPRNNDNDDDCKLCPKKVSKTNLILFRSLLNRLEKYDTQLSAISKLNPALDEKYKAFNDNPFICFIIVILLYPLLFLLNILAPLKWYPSKIILVNIYAIIIELDNKFQCIDWIP
jgi:hypothetical protein